MAESSGLNIRHALEIGVAHHRAGRRAQAETIYRRILEIAPGHPDALHMLGLAAHQAGDHRRALDLIGAALAARPDYAEAHSNCAKAYRALDEPDAARRHYERALSLKPNFAEAHNNLGDLLQSEGDLDAAIRHYEQAIAAREDFPQAHNNLGTALRERGATDEALVHYTRALTLDPDYHEARCNLGAALQEQGKTEAAIAHYRSVIEVAPGHVQAHLNLGSALQERGHIEAAISCYRSALKAQPGALEAHNNLGAALEQRGETEAAITAYRRAIRLHCDHVGVLTNLARLLHDAGHHEACLETYDRTLALDPDFVSARFGRCMAQLRPVYPDSTSIALARSGYLERLDELDHTLDVSSPPVARAAEQALGASQPFYLPYQGENDRMAQRRYGRMAVRIMAQLYPELSVKPPPPPRRTRLKVGIVSAFFRQHSNWKMPISGWLEQLDKRRFAVHGYHVGPLSDVCTSQARRVCERFVEHASFAEVCRAIVGDRLDVLVYPGLGMDPVSIRLAALRLAPVQCVSWGHPVTSGLPTMDYFLSSDLMEPDGADEHYTEVLIRLPNLSVYYEPTDPPTRELSRRELGLPDDDVLYLCAQAAPKYHPDDDALLARIATAVHETPWAPNPRFVFLASASFGKVTNTLQTRLASVFDAHGLNPTQHLLFLPRQTSERYAALNSLCDVALDTVGWSGCNSTLEALARDLPVVTLPGTLMRSRHSAAIFTMMGMTDTVAGSSQEYVELAVRFGTMPGAREAVRRRIAATKSLVYRDKKAVEGLEAFFEQVSAKPLN